MAKKERSKRDEELVLALSHPLRLRILHALDKQVASPAQLSRSWAEPLANVAYHVKVLRECNCLKLVRTRTGRGTVEHFYTAKAPHFIGSGSWLEMPPDVRASMSAAALDFLAGQLKAVVQAGTFEGRSGARVSCATIRVDDAGWDEVVKIVAAAERSLKKAASDSAKRLGGKPGISAVLALGAFEVPNRRAKTE